MRINKYLALHSELSRRGADEAITLNRVSINGGRPRPGQEVTEADEVTLDGKPLATTVELQTIIMNKPRGCVVSRDGQGSQTVYDLLPPELEHLQAVGRLDKDSSGLLLLTNDGNLAHSLTHPSFQKTKVYEVTLDKPLAPLHQQMITDIGVQLEDGRSQLSLERLKEGNSLAWKVTMHEGRNRQIRRTFESLGYTVNTLHRTNFGNYILPTSLEPGKYQSSS